MGLNTCFQGIGAPSPPVKDGKGLKIYLKDLEPRVLFGGEVGVGGLNPASSRV